jgi:hypothetical protein
LKRKSRFFYRKAPLNKQPPSECANRKAYINQLKVYADADKTELMKML